MYLMRANTVATLAPITLQIEPLTGAFYAIKILHFYTSTSGRHTKYKSICTYQAQEVGVCRNGKNPVFQFELFMTPFSR